MNGTLDQGQVIGGRWRIDQYLASGGFGQVYSATDVSTASIGAVAVKVLLEGASTAERQSFLSEAVHMSALRHPNLVSHIDSGMLAEDEGAVFLVIDLCDESLREYCDRQTSGTIRPERLDGLVGDVGAGLDYLHRSGRVHRDLKPGNILRAADRWKLADFGLVRDLSQSGVYHLQSLVGSPRYMAPEFFSDGMVGPAADIWAVGIIVHEVMTGQTVYSGEGPAYIHNVTSVGPTISPNLPPAAADLVRRCLATDPAQRPSADQLAPILAGAAGPAPIVSPSPDETTARVAPPPQVAPPAVAAATPAHTTGPPAGQDPPAFPPPSGAPSGPDVQPAASAGAAAPLAPSAGTAATPPPVLPPAPTERADTSKRRLALLAGVGVLALLGLGLWALLTGGDDGSQTATGTETDQSDDASSQDTLDETSSDTDTSSDGDTSSEDTLDDTAADDDTTSADSDEDGGATTDGDDGQGTGGEEAGGAAASNPRTMVPLDEFLPDECADVTSNTRFVIDTVVPCSDPHLFQILSVYESPQAGGEFPGSDALFQLGIARCPQAFLDRFGTDQADTSLSVLGFGPSEEEWNEQVYSVVCVMYRGDLQPLAGPIGDDVDEWLWKPGDSITAVELQRGHCFDTPVPLEIQGFGQRVLFADCEEPHDGQYFDSVLLEQPEGGYTDPLDILADGKPLCHDALHERYGDDHRESGFTDTVLVQSPAEYQQSPTNLLLCIVLWDEPTAGTLEDIVAEE